MLDHRVLTFLTVCDEMSFTRAAKKLHISQPAVSQHIQYIEEYYHIQAFQFTGKRISLTEAGRLLKDSLTSLYNNEIYLKEQLLAVTDLQHTLHFGATLTVGEFMIASPLSHFLTAHPTANISVTVANTKDLLKKLEAGEIDFAILEGSYPRHLYRHIPYITDRFIPICSGDYVLHHAPESLHSLLSERLLIRETGSGSRLILENALAGYDLGIEDFAQVTTIGNMNTIKEMVLDGCGITFLYETAVKAELMDGRIRQIVLPGWNILHEISVVWKKDHLFEGSLRQLITELFYL
nr:LysR family transcriptional regulator [uncultured Merdimonas sp.]